MRRSVALVVVSVALYYAIALRCSSSSSVAPATSSIQPSVGLYWTSNADPTVGPGVHAPLWQILFRTDAPGIYVKTGTADTAWTLLGVGTAATPQTTIAPRSYYYGFWPGDGLCNSGTNGCGFFDNNQNTSATYPVATPGNTDTTALGYGHFCTGGNATALVLNRGPVNTLQGGDVKLGAYAFDLQWRQRFPVLGDGTNSYVTRTGLANWGGNGNTTKEAVGAWAVVDHTTNGDVWALETCSATGSCTLSKCDGSGGTTNKPVVANTWYLVDLSTNSGGTQVSLAIDTVICTSSTTNIPTVGLNPGMQHVGTLGVVARCVDLNWFTIFAQVARP